MTLTPIQTPPMAYSGLPCPEPPIGLESAFELVVFVAAMKGQEGRGVSDQVRWLEAPVQACTAEDSSPVQDTSCHWGKVVAGASVPAS